MSEEVEPSWEVLLTRIARLRKENDYLRGLVVALPIPCTHCGLANMAQCARGFPGCAKADDLMCALDEGFQDAVGRMRAAEAKVVELKVRFCPEELTEEESIRWAASRPNAEGLDG